MVMTTIQGPTGSRAICLPPLALQAFFASLLLAILPQAAGASWLDNWEVRATPVPISQLAGLTYGKGIFVAVGSYYEDAPSYNWRPVVLSSPDGKSWTSREFPTNGATSVAYGNGVFVAVGGLAGPGNITTSSDGIAWTLRSAPESAAFLHSVSFLNGLFVAVGQNASVLTSTNGIDWFQRRSTRAEYLYGTAYGNGTFVTVGWAYADSPGARYRLSLTSHDGTNWDGATQELTPDTYNAVTFANGKFVAVGYGGITAISTDGTTWFNHGSGFSDALYAVTFNGDVFVAVGSGATILTSPDGVAWTKRASGSSSAITHFAVAPGNLNLVAVGNDIIQAVRRELTGRKTSGFEVTYISGDVGRPFHIEASTNLNTWIDLVAFPNSLGTNRFNDTGASALPRRFYRIRSQ